MTEWTVGPWKVQTYQSGKVSILHSVKADSAFVLADMMHSSNVDADARLIAAAPEMAELLARIADGWIATYGAKPEQASELARALLARINGE